MEKEQQAKQALLRALMTKPSIYTIDVIDNSMMPKGLKNKESISFEVKPPVINTMTEAALVLNRIPEKALDPKTPPAESSRYSKEMCEIFSIYAHGNSKEKFPDWHVAFLMANVTPVELIQLVQEVSLKTRTDFFLPSFQIASVMNPMMMTEPMEEKKKRTKITNPASDSIHTE